ncbi:MAG: phosphatidate cytidylyltransferase [Betaproteobacteria bacterium]|nr:phosphatidate cytidylyltransferase [Betaproteobacteria bacterium]
MLKLRLLTVAVVLPLFLAAMFLLPGAWWQLALVAPLLVAGHEWAKLARFSRAGAASFLFLLALGVALVWLTAVRGAAGRGYGAFITHAIYFFSVAFWLVIAPCWLWLKLAVRNRFVLGAAGVAVLLPLWLALAQLQANPLLLLFLFGVVWIADTAAYFFGKTLGRRKLAPAISPGKTWEGVGGAFAAVTVYALVLYLGQFIGHDLQFLIAAFFGMTVFSILGDLFESWLKRGAGVKDSGTILPGHGGMLDRIDGVMSALPLAALIFI